MAGFKMHIATSTLLGAGYGAAAYSLYQAPLPTCILAGGLCSVSGMLPDLDSGPGVPLRESMAFAAAVVPMMLSHRFQYLGLSHETMIVAGGILYLAIRFGVAELLRLYTVHRGMFHSIPAALIFGELAYLLSPGDDAGLRLFKAGGVVIGFLSHLVLDEIYSVEWTRGRVKNSFGTAIKFFSPNWWPNISAYGKLALLTVLIFHEPTWLHQLHQPGAAQQTASGNRAGLFRK